MDLQNRLNEYIEQIEEGNEKETIRVLKNEIIYKNKEISYLNFQHKAETVTLREELGKEKNK